jgi:hypothetical protein
MVPRREDYGFSRSGWMGKVAFSVTLLLCASLARAAKSEDNSASDVTVMEKMIVEAAPSELRPGRSQGLMGIITAPPVWLYASVSDYEILSLCDSTQTIAAARHLADSLDLDAEFVPEPHLGAVPVPMSFIMFDHPQSKALEALIPSTLDMADPTNFGIYHERVTLTEGGGDIRDSDTHCAIQNRWGMAWAWAGASAGRGPIPTGLMFRMSRVTPALPLWYEFGFIGPCGLLRMAGGSNGMMLASAKWITSEETKKMADEFYKSNRRPVLPPVQGLFSRAAVPRTGYSTEWPNPDWMAEAALFVRWGRFSGTVNRKAFDTFVEKCRSMPATERLFTECFGFGYAEAQKTLSEYLVSGAQDPLTINFESLSPWRPHDDPRDPAYPHLTCREASPGEIARLLGDWERMEGDALKNSNPALSGVYLRRAGRTLTDCYDNGERDPRFLAVLGLYYFDIHDFVDGEPILGEAAKASVVRPAAYVDLSRIRLESARAHPSSPLGISADQLASVLRPLFTSRKMATLPVEGYELISEAWSLCAVRPALPNLAVLAEGLRLYPLDETLAAATAATYSHWGYQLAPGPSLGRN